VRLGSIRFGNFVSGSICDCKSVSSALVQMKARTVAMERKQQDKSPKENGFTGGVHRQMLINACSTEVIWSLLED